MEFNTDGEKMDPSTNNLDSRISDDERLNKLFGKNLFDQNQENTEVVTTKTESDTSRTIQTKKTEFDARRVRTFFIMLAKAAMRHQIRLKAHGEFHNQVDKLKDTIHASVKQKPKERKIAVDTEIDDLKRKVSYLISIERGLASSSKEGIDPANHKEFQTRLEQLEQKISQLVQHKQAREERFNKLEEKINAKITGNNTNSKDLQSKYTKSTQKNSDEDHTDAITELNTRLLLLQRNLLRLQIASKKLKSGTKEQKIMNTELQDIQQKIQLTKNAIERLQTP